MKMIFAKAYKLIWVILIILTSNLYSQPQWLVEIPEAPHLYQAIAGGEDQKSADENAIVDIARQIEVIVTTKSGISKPARLKNGEIFFDSFDSTVVQITDSYVEQTLKGLTIKDRYYHPERKIYYTYATLEKEGSDQIIWEKAVEAEYACLEYQKYANKALEKHDVSTAIENRWKALYELYIAQKILGQRILHNAKALQPVLESDLTAAISQLSLRVISGSDQLLNAHSGLNQPLIGQMIYGSGIPVRNFPVQFEFIKSEGESTERTFTNHEGKFTCIVTKVRETSNGVAEIKCKPVFPDAITDHTDLIIIMAEAYVNTGCNFRIYEDTGRTAVQRSLLCPGLGQITNHQNRGWLYLSSFLATTGLSLYYWSEFDTHQKDYTNKKTRYEITKLQNDYESMNDAIDTRDSQYAYAMAFTGMAVGIYLWNVVDALVWGNNIDRKSFGYINCESDELSIGFAVKL